MPAPTPVNFLDIDVMNQAVTGAFGVTAITDLNSTDSTPALVMVANYEAVSESAQTRTAWRFNTTKVALNKLSGVPLNRWGAAWQLPPDMLKILTTWPISNYEIQGNRLLSNNTSELHLDYQRKIAEALWPPWFLRYVVARLVMRTVKGITGKKADQDMKDELVAAENEALTQDAQQQPNQTMMSNAFVDVRR